MNLSENLKDTWQIISRNKIRSFLTMLGIIIGIMSVIIIMSVGAGAQSLILNQVKSLGSNLVGVLPGKADDDGPPASAMGILITTLKYSDAQAIANSGFAPIQSVAAYVRGVDTVTWGYNKVDTNFLGTSASYIDVENTKVDQGRFFTEAEEKGTARVAVLGSQVAKDLFGSDDPIGQRIKIKKTSFNIIGVMTARGVSGFQNQDNQIFVPVTTAQKLLLGINHVSFMRIKIDQGENVAKSREFIKQVLRDRHNIDKPENDDFSVRSLDQGLAALTSITDALRLFLTSIAAIALVVGGVGIMNIMLAAVQERTREIGLRKAVGAKSNSILGQFLIETATITFLGGLIGILLGTLISVLVAKVAQSMGYNWDLIVSAMSIILACVVSIGIGLLFGLVPARRASKLDPIAALRYE